MKKNSLTTAVVASIAGVAGFAGLANAVHLNPDGIGQVLLYPYYTVNDNQQTLLSVVNTAAVAKAVKVRFLEGYNTREVLDFNLFLSPYDVWTATIFSMQGESLQQAQSAIFAADMLRLDFNQVDHSDWIGEWRAKTYRPDPDHALYPALFSASAYQRPDAVRDGMTEVSYEIHWTRYDRRRARSRA